MNSKNETPGTIFCSEVARAAGAPLLGTATEASVWLLLEVNSAWPSRVLSGNDLPEATQRFLSHHETAVPGGRVLFIKKQRPEGDKLRLFVADTRAGDPQLYEIHLHSYAELGDVAIGELLAGGPAAARYARREPLFLICANGKRDKCCAKFGLAAYRALNEVEPEATWQSSHIGGHRHAPNVLFLPHSINYGQLTPQETVQAAAAYRAGKLLDLAHYRGRTSFAPPIQAAAIYLREALGELGAAAPDVQETEALADGRWRVTLSFGGQASHTVSLLAAESTEPQLVSCSPPALKPVEAYTLLDIAAAASPPAAEA